MSTISNRIILYCISSVLLISTGLTTYNKLQDRVSKWYKPVKENFFSFQMLRTEFSIDDIKEGLSVIPSDASVCASENLVPHLAFRDYAHCFPNVHESEYIAFLKGGSTYPLTPDEFEKEKNKYLNNPEWITVYEGTSIQVIKKNK